jgi:hypothetical protein
MTTNSSLISIRDQLSFPEDMSKFNPAAYFNDMKFSNPSSKYSAEDAEGLVQLMYICNSRAMRAMSNARNEALLDGHTSFFETLRTNFSTLADWQDIEQIIAKQGSIYFTDMIHFFFQYIDPYTST